ncbi:MAG: hypothetical protein JXA52_06945 [Planctomycetes bacterium]|nr:hypothetical protein [Planctomycetota bacterium]
MNFTIVTEASERIGYGHLLECLAVASYLPKESVSFILIASDTAAGQLVAAQGYSACELDWPELMAKQWPTETTLLADTRENTPEMQAAIAASAQHFVLLDEFSGKELFCDAVVNFSIDPAWHNYPSESKAKRYLGPKYYPLRQEFHAITKSARGNSALPRVLITLGGADRTRSTLFLAECFAQIDSAVFTYIVGPGFNFGAGEIAQYTGGGANHQVITAPENFGELLAAQDVVISAGGNTLYEAAALGVPALVLWEDPHEEIQGQAFTQAGAAKMLGNAGKDAPEEIRKAVLELLTNDKALEKLAATGRKIVDGCGAQRIAAILKGEQHDRL